VVIVEVLCLGRQNKATDFWAIREHRRAKYGSSRVKVISKAATAIKRDKFNEAAKPCWFGCPGLNW
jgi:hypothetical protein